jgi:hypothetical protein
MDLFLRKVIHPHADDRYRVILKDGGGEIQLGSISVQLGTSHWGIFRHPDARARNRGHWHGPQGLHARQFRAA